MIHFLFLGYAKIGARALLSFFFRFVSFFVYPKCGMFAMQATVSLVRVIQINLSKLLITVIEFYSCMPTYQSIDMQPTVAQYGTDS